MPARIEITYTETTDYSLTLTLEQAHELAALVDDDIPAGATAAEMKQILKDLDITDALAEFEDKAVDYGVTREVDRITVVRRS